VGKVLRGIGEFVKEFVGEALIVLFAFGVVTGARILIKWGWRSAPVAVVGVLAVVAAFLAFGVSELFRSADKRRTGPLATVAKVAKVSAGVVAFVAAAAIPVAFGLL
jgi:energy-coupling factor transporter transmembrane protein EcfT